MTSNFSFLKNYKIFADFTEACLEAEKSLVVSYATTAILSRRALELAVKWVYSNDSDLKVPYQDNLTSLIHDYTFKNIIEPKLFPMLKYIIQLGNQAVHSNKNITKEQAVLALKNLFEFISWIHYCYAGEYSEIGFNESILQFGEEQHLTQKELQDLYERLNAKDRKLEEVVKENDELRHKLTFVRNQNTTARHFKVDEITEFETRKMYIDLEIQLASWTIGRDCIEEVAVKGMPNNTGDGFVDYVLYGDDGKPLALIEAKRTSCDARKGKQQAKLYADCLETKYGQRPIIFFTNGFDHYIWDDSAYPERKIAGILTKDELEWMIFKRKNKQPLYSVAINDDISNREYQKRAIMAVCNTLERGHRKALLVMATGSGKTRTAISIVDVLKRHGWVKNILFLADRVALVKQAKKSFKYLLPDLSLCNLLDNKDNPESRMIFSTYPTMMNAIDDTKRADGSRLFTPGHFDLIIIDESHRSIYKKYQAIFDYFDGILLGLTATPRDEIDKNTYEVFDLENNVPTFAYELNEAIAEKYLVPYHSVEVKQKFLEEGVHYDQLSEEDKAKFEETFDEEDPRDFGEDELNKFLFNNSTVDYVIDLLLEKGIKVEGGDKIGKTIIFAKNKRHADFIVDRFNRRYPAFRSEFMQPIYHGIVYGESIMDNFSTKDRLPQIAVSVDMLDTGIDIPEIVNLVFFKKVRSKSKFWQMIGRGTRLCENLFGPGLHKENFRIFDYCSNFEFFRENPKGKEVPPIKSLTENLFEVKVDIIRELQNFLNQAEEYAGLREQLVTDVANQIKQLDDTRFNVRQKLRYVHKYRELESWEAITDSDVRELREHISSLLSPVEEDELAKRFDYLMYSIELAHLLGRTFTRSKTKVMDTAYNLSGLGTITQIKQQREIIEQVQTDEFWASANVFDYERVREALRDLLKFLERESIAVYYTDFHDEILSIEQREGEFSVNDLKSYRIKVNQYLKEHQNDLAIYKLRNNEKLTKQDLATLEDILWNQLGSKDDYQRTFGEEKLTKLVRSIVGLDVSAANREFSDFLTDETLNINQMEFVKLIVNYIVKNGIMDMEVFERHPFNQFGSIVRLFENKRDVARKLIDRVRAVNNNALELYGA